MAFPVLILLLQRLESVRMILLEFIHPFIDLGTEPFPIDDWWLGRIRILTVVGVVDPVSNLRLDESEGIILLIHPELQNELAIVDAKLYLSVVLTYFDSAVTMEDTVIPTIFAVSTVAYLKGKNGLQVTAP